MANASLVVRISAQIAEFQKSFDDASKTAKKFAGDFEGIATRAAAVGAFFGNIASDIAKSLASGFAGAIKDAVKFSSELTNAFAGLNSVSRGFGIDTNAAADAARRLSADGLIPLKQSTTALKNLLSAGFGLPDAIKLLDVAKDSAAFNRQGFLSMGEAVERFTQGIKFNNSQLTDSTGLGKNLSKVMTDAGFSADAAGNAMHDYGVQQAIVNGFTQQGIAFTGDAARVAQTYSGQLMGMQNSWTNLLATWGDAITKNATVSEALGAVRDLFTQFNGVLSNNQKAYFLVSDAIIGFVNIIAWTVRAIDTLQSAFNGLDSIIAGVTQGILKSVKFIADSLLKILTIASKVPGSGIALGAVADQIVGLGIVTGTVTPQIKSLEDRIADNDRRSARWSQTLGGVASHLDTLAQNLKETRGKVVDLGTSTGGLVQHIDTIPPAAGRASSSLKKWLNESIPLINRFKEDLSKLTPEALIPFINVSQRAWPMTIEGLQGIVDKFPIVGTIVKDTTKTISERFSELSQALSQLSQIAGGAFGGMVKGIGTVISSIDIAVKSAKSLTEGFAAIAGKATLEGFAAIATGLAGVVAAGAQIGKGLQPLLGLRHGKLGELLGTNATGRQAVIDFAALFGGFDQLHAKLATLGAEGEGLWIKLTQGVGRANPAEARAAIDAINEAFGIQSDRLGKTQAVLTEYGITFEQTGEKFRNSTLAAAFDELFEKTEILKGAGVDYNLILEKQASQYSELAAKAIATNTEIPASMRPLLEKLQEMGLLTDAATGEFIDLGKVKWAQTLTEGFKSVTDAINRLADSLSTGVGGALDTLSRRVIRIPIKFDVDEIPGGGSVPALAGGGIVRRPTLALIGESGPEAVVPLSRAGMGLSGDGGGDTYVFIGNEQLDARTVKVTRTDAARGGLRPRVSSGRSY